MPSSEPTSLWWDRDADESGHHLREDVREAAHKFWMVACKRTLRVLRDVGDAPELLEAAVRSVSHYLDKKRVPLFSADPGGLVALAFHRSLHRLARRRGRVEAVGGGSELAEMLRAPDWSDEVDRRLFLERLARELSKRSRGILRRRIEGDEWKDIAQMLGMTTAAVKTSFWRDVRKAHLRLLGMRNAERAR
jgi:predicted transcriptional regulator